MVDFNSENAVSTPPGDIVKIVLLERREQVVEALENLDLAKANRQDTTIKIDILYARVRALWNECQAMAVRRLKKAKGTDDDPTYAMVEKALLEAKEEAELYEAYKWLNKFIDEMGITKIDTRKNYDEMDIEEANMSEGI